MTEYTFQRGGPEGITVQIKNITRYQCAMLRSALDVKYPKPSPPIEETNLGPVANPSHPDYIAEVEAWSVAQQNRLNVVVLHACVTADAALVASTLAQLDADIAETRVFMESVGLQSDIETTYERDVFSVDDSPLVRFLYLVAAAGDAKYLMDVLDIIGRSLDSREVTQQAVANMF